MSIATVVTEGFGSFGSVNFLPTEGYSDFGAVTPVTIGGRVLRPRKRHRGDLKALYAQLVAAYQPAAAAEVLPVAAIVRPYAAPSDAALPPVAAVDFAAIERSTTASRRLAAALGELMDAAAARADALAIEQDDEDVMDILLQAIAS